MAATSLFDKVFRRRKKKSTEFTKNSALFEFDFDTIRDATNEFSCPVGRDGFGSVYRGRLQIGQEIAVKIYSGSSLIRSERDFHNELNLLSKLRHKNLINLLSKLRHKNLINLLGFCTKRDQKFLVYEFMPNSSLDCYIFDPQRASQLSWEICRNIIEGIARGLRYLHEESGLSIVHRDIKPANILLDSNLKSKIAAFELAKMMQQGESEAESTVICGTVGYLDPDYMRTGRVSIKSDVYAFGVTILTIISKRRPLSVGEDSLLIEYVLRCWNRGETIDVIHEVMREEERGESIREILRYIHIALLCINENAETRPSLDEVLHWFSCFSTPLPLPEPSIGNRILAAEETNQSWSPSLSPSNSSVTSLMSPR